MNKKNSLKKTAALLLGIALTVGATGCDFIKTDNVADLNQVVATVNVYETLKSDENYKGVADGVKKIMDNLSANVSAGKKSPADISKRDLVAFFLSTGYQYVESYGYSYKDTFNMLMDNLVNREIMIQYAMAYFLANNENLTADGCLAYVESERAAATDNKEKTLLENNPEVSVLKYFLTENGTKIEEYDRTVYSLKKSINDSLDSIEEQKYIKAESEEHDHGSARTLPNGVGTEKEDYYTNEYEVYTGNNTLGTCGEYEKVEGSTTSTRKRAYNAFLANLQSFNMIATDADNAEDAWDVTHLNYYYTELSSSLGQALINKYFDALEESVIAKLNEEGEDGKSYTEKKYQEVLASQKETYEKDPTAFETAMDSVSDTSFLLYGLKDFGFVYNILLPFSTEQNIVYTEAKNNKANTQDDLYNIRKDILKGVKGKDLRDSWISSHDHANYSYTKEDGKYYFFEDEVKGTNKYEKLTQYAGTYAYNGTVEKDGDEFKCTPNEESIDSFISILENHIEATAEGVTVSGAKKTAYDTTTYVDTVTKEVEDYGKFTYYTGKANVTATAKDYFNPESNIYKTISAVNELMFAYSTDTGCLNTYLGYAVSPYGTNFVKEFEYAAQYVVKEGVGSYAVCATDYGWHIVFASYVYGDGEVYEGGYIETEAETEGTFSNLFYESLKATAAKNYSTEVQNSVLNRYNNDNNVTLFTSRYQDLLDLEK